MVAMDGGKGVGMAGALGDARAFLAARRRAGRYLACRGLPRPVVPGHGGVVDAAFVVAQRDELAQLATWLTDPAAHPPFDEATRATARTRA